MSHILTVRSRFFLFLCQKNARKRKLTTAQKQEHKELATERFESRGAKRERMDTGTAEADDAASSGSERHVFRE